MNCLTSIACPASVGLEDCSGPATLSQPADKALNTDHPDIANCIAAALEELEEFTQPLT